MEEENLCPICFDNPTSCDLDCGKSVCAECALKLIYNDNCCPFCRGILTRPPKKTIKFRLLEMKELFKWIFVIFLVIGHLFHWMFYCIFMISSGLKMITEPH